MIRRALHVFAALASLGFLGEDTPAQPAATVATPAAATPAAATARLNEAWEAVLAGEEPILTPNQFAQLNNLAYQSAVIRSCPGYELNTPRFSSGLSSLILNQPRALTVEQEEQRKTGVLIAFGTRYGLFIAEGRSNLATFCAGAAAFRADPDGVPVYWN
ncbi:hypothetical protein [Ancylobacter lacus]|uniref:hypothetical protein n=1 Tax=Ancylobacter lacus TaxID=2579970 RepID=UPI001BCD6CE3|nr:hypothetical protein [Ancylobacter lacus]MBS7538432.1 hypothetical protein [Ancylobacter lacus]